MTEEKKDDSTSSTGITPDYKSFDLTTYYDCISTIDDKLLSQVYSTPLNTTLTNNYWSINTNNLIQGTVVPWNGNTVIYNNTLNNTSDLYYYNKPAVKPNDKTLDVELDDGSIVTLSREDLIKYISEQALVRDNEVVRKLYERFQVGAKLARSDDDGNERS